MNREKIYEWLNMQIEANEILNIPLDTENPNYICMAGYIGTKSIHIYGIDRLCKELDIECEVEKDYTKEYDLHYFMYNGYKIYGLAEKEGVEV